MSKLSVLVATKVMEWPTIDRDTPYRTISTQGGYVCEGVVERRSTGIMFQSYRPDSNIADAMEVFDKFPNATLRKETVFGETMYEVDIGEVCADNQSMCIAICLAALRAVGMTDQEIGEALR